MNELVTLQVVEIPLVLWNNVQAMNKKLQDLNLSPWVSQLWNIENRTMEG